jgi:hypothetical protein
MPSCVPTGSTSPGSAPCPSIVITLRKSPLLIAARNSDIDVVEACSSCNGGCMVRPSWVHACMHMAPCMYTYAAQTCLDPIGSAVVVKDDSLSPWEKLQVFQRVNFGYRCMQSVETRTHVSGWSMIVRRRAATHKAHRARRIVIDGWISEILHENRED